MRGELETEQNCNILTPHSHGQNSVSFLFSWAAQPGAWGPSLSGTWSSFQHLLSNWLTSCLHPGYIIVRHPPSCGRHKSHSFNPSTVKVIFWYSSTGCTCYLHRCISYFDSLAGVNMLHYLILIICLHTVKWFQVLLCFDLPPGPKMLFQGDAPEGSDTFQWPVIKRYRVGGLRLIIWDKVKVPRCHYIDAPEESDLWTAWQLFPVDDD